jgi:hypothetical protein
MRELLVQVRKFLPMLAGKPELKQFCELMLRLVN